MYSTEDIRRRNREQGVSETDPFTEDRYRQFARFVSPGWEVLDIGCNTGRGGAALVEAAPGITLDGLEMLEERLGLVPPGVYRSLRSCSLRQLIDDGHSYDAVLLGEVIEHVPYAQLDPFVHEVLELTRPAGLIALTTPNPHSLMSRLRSRSVLGGAHVSVHCAQALGQLFLHHGAEGCEIVGSGRSTRYIGSRMPLAAYGSYLMLVRAGPAR